MVKARRSRGVMRAPPMWCLTHHRSPARIISLEGGLETAARGPADGSLRGIRSCGWTSRRGSWRRLPEWGLRLRPWEETRPHLTRIAPGRLGRTRPFHTQGSSSPTPLTPRRRGPGITWSVQVNRIYGVSGELSGDGSPILAGASARESALAFPPPTRSARRGVARCSTGTATSSLFMAVPLHCLAWPSTSGISGCGEGARAGSLTGAPPGCC